MSSSIITWILNLNLPESMNAIYNLWEILLVIKVCQLKNETLKCWRLGKMPLGRVIGTYFR